MKWISRYKIEIILGIILSLVFFSTRFYHILSLPIFTDEAIYLRWAQIAKNDAAWRFISLTDGKQPLFIWLTMVLMKPIHDPVLAGRTVSVFAGFTTAGGLFFLGRELFRNRWIGIIAAFLYVISPFGLVYDRMALYDSLVGTFAVWSLYGEVLLVRKIRLDIALILGLVIGASVLNKSNGFFSIYLLPFTLLLFDFRHNHRYMRLGKWVIFASVTTVLAFICYSILRLSPFYHIINEKNATFIYPLSEWLGHPFAQLTGNLMGQWNWFSLYVSIPVLIAILVSFFIDKKFLREKTVLFLWFFLPFLALGLFGKVIYPRYILFMVLTLFPLFAYTLYRLFSVIQNKFIYIMCFLLVCSVSLYTDYFILTNFSHSPIPQSDLNQYSNDWPSGGGVKESIAFFKGQAESGKIYIGTEGTFGLMPFAYELYLVQNPNVIIKGFWPIHDTPPPELENAAKKMPTYVVFYQPCPSCASVGEAPITWPVTPLLQVKKGAGNGKLTVYQLK